MPTYQHPGVYIEEIPSGAKPIEGVATSVAAFVGWTKRGPIGEPVLIHNPEDYERSFGLIDGSSDNMGHAVNAFYLNGGKTAYVMRLAGSSNKEASATLVEGANAWALRVLATSEGEWGNKLRFRVTRPSPLNNADPRFTLEVGRDVIGPDGVLEFKALEVYSNLSMDPRHQNYAITIVNGSSQIVKLELDEESTNAVKNACNAGTLKGATCPVAGAGNSWFKDNLDDELQLAIILDGLPPQNIKFTPKFAPSDPNTGRDLTADGQAVAQAIQGAVTNITGDPFNGFTCNYDGDAKQFVLTSPKSASSSVAVAPKYGVAEKLGLNTATASHGALLLIPLEQPVKLAPFPSMKLEGGNADEPESADDFRTGFAALKKIRDISIIVLPNNANENPGETAIAEALAHCEDTGNRVLIIDPPKDTTIDSADDVNQLGLPTSKNAVCYYPWVKVRNPLYHPETNPTADKTVEVAPSAFMAGLWSRTDGKRGVWKAPAGVEASLLGAAGLADDVGDGQQDQLNPLGINCIRKLPNYGIVVWGSRTLATKADPEWRYVPVRRTAIMIEESIYNGIQWAVFEPNDHRLWAALRVNIGSFMDGLFRAGAFQGDKASDAYFVRCGLGDTMTQGDIDRGQVIVQVGFAPLKPAEFVIVRIQQKVQQ